MCNLGMKNEANSSSKKLPYKKSLYKKIVQEVVQENVSTYARGVLKCEYFLDFNHVQTENVLKPKRFPNRGSGCRRGAGAKVKANEFLHNRMNGLGSS